MRQCSCFIFGPEKDPFVDLDKELRLRREKRFLRTYGFFISDKSLNRNFSVILKNESLQALHNE